SEPPQAESVAAMPISNKDFLKVILRLACCKNVNSQFSTENEKMNTQRGAFYRIVAHCRH
ncbi:MAG: hypothetical protein MK192_09565, partial [Idiomarina sp.]|nr:hypothetical protein [Idiomarina sp.]